jgi:hypothetical protein
MRAGGAGTDHGTAGATRHVVPTDALAGATDMRKQINGLSVLVEEVLEADPFAYAVLQQIIKARQHQCGPLEFRGSPNPWSFPTHGPSSHARSATAEGGRTLQLLRPKFTECDFSVTISVGGTPAVRSSGFDAMHK